jgi:hypothetical protein
MLFVLPEEPIHLGDFVQYKEPTPQKRLETFRSHFAVHLEGFGYRVRARSIGRASLNPW